MEKEFNNAWNNLSEDEQRKLKLKVFESVDLPTIEEMLSILNEIQPLLKNAIIAIDEKDSEKGIGFLKEVERITGEKMKGLSSNIEKRRINKQ